MYKIKRFSLSTKDKIAAGLVGAGLVGYPVGGVIGAVKGSRKDPKKLILDKELNVEELRKKHDKLVSLKKQGKLKYDENLGDWIDPKEDDDEFSGLNITKLYLDKAQKTLDNLNEKGLKGIKRDFIKSGFNKGAEKGMLIGAPLAVGGAYLITRK